MRSGPRHRLSGGRAEEVLPSFTRPSLPSAVRPGRAPVGEDGSSPAPKVVSCRCSAFGRVGVTKEEDWQTPRVRDRASFPGAPLAFRAL